jgi:hypothetical protein
MSLRPACLAVLALCALGACATPSPPAAPTAAPTLTAPPPPTVVPAPTDEHDPRTWTFRLEDPAQRAGAARRLAQLFDDAMTYASTPNKRDDEKVRRLVDVIALPLATAYESGGTDDESRRTLLKLLAELGDPTAAGAFARAFKAFVPGTNDDELKYAAQGTVRLAQAGRANDPRLAAALWDCFASFTPSKHTRSINLVRDLQAAVMSVKDASYGPKAVELLTVPVLDPRDPAEGMDKIQFWQLTAARLIGELRYAPGVKPLVRVLMTPAKRDLVFPVRSALTRMPRESEPVLLVALAGTDPELAALAASYPDNGSVPRVAEPLAYISRRAGRDAILAALARADNDTNRTVLAIELTHFARETHAVKAFLEAYRKVPGDVEIPLLGGANAHAILAQAAAGFFDPSLTGWLLKENADAKGDAADAMPPAALPAAIKLMTTASAPAVRAAVGKIPGKAIEKDMLVSASAVLASCKEDAACYARFLDTPVPASPPAARMGHVKAAWMAGIYGSATMRGELVAKVEKLKDPSVRLAVVEAILHLAPDGDAAGAGVLEAIVETERKAGENHASDEVSRIAQTLRSRVP